jgi:hypothetical protein
MKLVDRLIQDIENGIADTQRDMGDEAPGEDDIAWEIMNSVLAGHSVWVHNEVRLRMGFDPLTRS